MFEVLLYILKLDGFMSHVHDSYTCLNIHLITQIVLPIRNMSNAIYATTL